MEAVSTRCKARVPADNKFHGRAISVANLNYQFDNVIRPWTHDTASLPE
jgi:hypothetical protein